MGPRVVHWPPPLYLLNYVPNICVLLVNIRKQRKTRAYFKQCYISSRLSVQALCAAIFICRDFLRCFVSPPLRLSTVLSSWQSKCVNLKNSRAKRILRNCIFYLKYKNENKNKLKRKFAYLEKTGLVRQRKTDEFTSPKLNLQAIFPI